MTPVFWYIMLALIDVVHSSQRDSSSGVFYRVSPAGTVLFLCSGASAEAEDALLKRAVLISQF